MNFEVIEKSWKAIQRLEQRLFPQRINGFQTTQKVVLTKVEESPERVVVTFSNLGTLSKNREQAVQAFLILIKSYFEKSNCLVQDGRSNKPDAITLAISANRPVGVARPEPAIAESKKKKNSKMACIDVSEADESDMPTTKVIADAVPKKSKTCADPLTKIVERRKFK